MDRKSRVLVVDDERGIREGCRRVLLAEGYEVETAEDGERGLEAIAPCAFDLILVDVKMPGMGGIQLVRRSQEIDPSIVAIMITGYATIETAIEATRSGAYDFVPKPFTPDELTAKVRKGLEHRRLMVEASRLREERERSLIAISAEKSKLLTVVNCMQDPVLVTNREGQLVLFNPAALSLLVSSRDDLVGRPVQSCCRITEIADILTATLTGRGPAGTMLTREVAGPGKDQTLMVNVAPVVDEGAEIIGSVTVARDVSRLKELDRTKSQFVAMVAHELKSPLGVISGYTDLLLSGMAGELTEDARQMLERSKERASSLVRLVDDLLDVSNLEAGRVARRVEAIYIADLLSESVEAISAREDGMGIGFELDVADDLPPVKADREELLRAMGNLLSNAVKYNRERGFVRISACSAGSYVRVDVTDGGFGIPAECIPRLFEEFYRVKSPETRHISGTGLGLAIVKRIVDAHHGRILVESVVGQGSTFSLFIPAVPVAAAPPAVIGEW